MRKDREDLTEIEIGNKRNEEMNGKS